jgi:histone chaperone ASF1
MALVNVTDVVVLNNPSDVHSHFQFDITFECLQELPEDLEWRVTYVGNAEDPSYDQTLEEVMVGPLVVGINRFVLQAPPPDYSKIAQEDLVGVTVVLISCFYVNREFLKIGYYVANEYTVEIDPENPPYPVRMDLLRRNIAADQPRVTRIPIDWNCNHNENIPYEEADPSVPVEEEMVMDGEMEDDMEMMSGNEDSMDVANMQNMMMKTESN